MNGLGRALGYLWPYRATASGALVSLLLVSAANLITPQILRAVVDQGISAKNLEAITYAAGALVAVAAVRGIFTFGQTYLSEKASQGAAYDLRNTIFAHLQHLSFSYHDQAQTGQLMTRVTNDVTWPATSPGWAFCSCSTRRCF
jgi:ATP-binding cassette subfamily B protein